MPNAMTPLETSELRYRRLFERARDGILILDLTTLKIVDANPYIQELLGYSQEDLLGRELWEIGLFQDRAQSQQVYDELNERKVIRYEDLPLQAKDGQVREVEFVSNIYDEGGHPVAQCNIRDISQRKLIEEQRERLVQAEKLKLLGEMARSVAHDLNQSLGLISGYSDLASNALTETPLDLEALRDMHEIMAQAATDGGLIVSRLLTFARGQPEGPAEEVPLPALLARVGQLTAPLWRDTSRAEGRTITLYVESELDASVLGWPSSLREALVNLVFNAVDALPEGGIIRLRAYRQDQKVVIEVQDTGTGMSAEVQSQVFQPLFTTKGAHGTGLGLAQVMGAVEQHGAQVTIESILGQGTTFRLTFPASHGSVAAVIVPPATSSLAILVVDDEPALADLLTRMLRVDGHAAVAVHSGASALERLNTESFDLVISDMGMPGMDGWELTRQVQSHYPTMPVIIASGWGSQIAPEEARERGIEAIVAKPYRRSDLQKALATLGASPKRPVTLTEMPEKSA